MFTYDLLYIVTPCFITVVAILFNIHILPRVVRTVLYLILYILITYLIVLRHDLVLSETRFPIVNDKLICVMKAVRI
jgi:hypothetical protein